MLKRIVWFDWFLIALAVIAGVGVFLTGAAEPLFCIKDPCWSIL